MHRIPLLVTIAAAILPLSASRNFQKPFNKRQLVDYSKSPEEEDVYNEYLGGYAGGYHHSPPQDKHDYSPEEKDPNPWQVYHQFHPFKHPKATKAPKGEPTKPPKKPHHYKPTKQPKPSHEYSKPAKHPTKEPAKSKPTYDPSNEYHDPYAWHEMKESDEEAWDEYIAGHDPKPPKHDYSYEESKEDYSKEDSKDDYYDPYAWYQMDESDEDAWDEYIAGHGPEPPKHKPHYDPHPWYSDDPHTWYPKGTKAVKGEAHDYKGKDPKGDKVTKGYHPPVDNGKVEEEDEGKDGEGTYHYNPMPNRPRPHPVSKEEPKDPYADHGQPYPDPKDAEEDYIEDNRVSVHMVLKYKLVEYAREPKQEELYIITAQTDSFLESYLDKFFDEYIHDVELDYFVLVPTEGVDPQVEGYVITLDYRGVAFFESEKKPTYADMAAIIDEAFLNENLDEYLERLNYLPKDNIFSTATHVTVTTSIPNGEASKLLKTMADEAGQTVSSSSTESATSKTILIGAMSMVAATSMVALAVAIVVVQKKRRSNRNDDEMSFVESVFIGDQGCLVEKELGDQEFEVSSVHSNTDNTTRAENFLRLVARDEEDDYNSEASTFRIEMGGNRSFSRA